jgi:hypothetical protein
MSLSDAENRLIHRNLYVPTVTMGLNRSPEEITLRCPEQARKIASGLSAESAQFCPDAISEMNRH